MKKLRPTIPVFESKLAVNLEETNYIQNPEDSPAFNCQSKVCKIWKSSYDKILAKELMMQLIRVGIDLKNPSDCYEFSNTDEGLHVRVVYFAVGTILSGPNQWLNNEIGELLMYKTIQEKPFSSIVILLQKDYFGYSPTLNNTESGNIIRIDLRLVIPNEFIHIKLSENQ